MPVNKNEERNKENEREINSSKTKEDKQRKSSAFNEKPVGRQSETIFSETSPHETLGEENDILSGSDRKGKPQQDAEV